MNLVRRRMNFQSFLDDYVSAGLLFGIIICICVSIIFLMVWYELRDTKIVENNIYLALRGEKVKDETAIKIADFISRLYHDQNFNFEELKKVKEVLIDGNKYFNAAIEHLDKVELILEGKPEAVEIDIKNPIWRWKYFFIMAGLISWLIMAVAMSISYLVESAGCRDGILTYPWGEIWSYPLIVLMFPYLVISQPILLIWYGIQRLRGNEEQMTEERIRTDESLPISPQELQERIDRQRHELKSKISSIKAAVAVHCQNWIKICKQRLIEEEQETESEINDCRSHLSEFGRKIETEQRILAESQSRLGNLKRLIKNNRIKEEKEFALEFNKLRKIPHVEAVEVVDEEIRVYTDTIYISYQEKKYEIGDFLIRLTTKRNRPIKIENLCNTSTRNQHHPYGYRDSSFCFGHLSNYVTKLLEQKDYFSLTVVILQVLQSNEGDAPEAVKFWKEVKDKNG